ncbi:proline-rich protein 18-like [Pelmatolapia mariae]|uniref:proline-rich protein 18-like n=1 Tax=Pelmatolapia mariae TaxID=158779 RepID=UPI002FE63730
MAEDASEYLNSVRKSLSSLVPSSFFFRHFTSKSELLSYLMLCVAKMPFIPPVSIARSMSGLAGKERPTNNISSVSAVTKAKALKEDKGGSVKERLALNLKQLGKKSQPRSNLPTTKGVSGANRREGSLPSSQTGSSPVTSSESLSKRQQHKHCGHTSVKSDSQVKPVRTKDQQEVRFTLTLTPEAVLLLQRRNSERHRQRSVARNPASGATLAPGGATESRRRRENVPKRQRNGSHSGRVTAKNSTDAELGDINSILKISLLNERHKYDDVEYEEEEDYGVDERVVLKCTEWLRGLENAPMTAGNRLSRSASSVKSF